MNQKYYLNKVNNTLTKNTLKQNKTKTLKVFEKMLNCGDRTQPHRYTLRDVKDILDNNKHIIKHLNNIGYCFLSRNNHSYFVKTVKAFQRHYRKELINGVPDMKTYFVLIDFIINL